MKPAKAAAILATLALAVPTSASAIVGGRAVKSSAYPYTVRLTPNGVSGMEGGYCAGSLIAPNVVLTAGHCVLENIEGAKGRHYVEATSTDVLFGSTFLGDAEVVRSKEVIPHPLYNKSTGNFDAALIVLEHPVSAHTVLMSGTSPRAGSTVSAAGWGSMTEWEVGRPAHLRAVDLKVRTLTDCKRGNPPLGSLRFNPSTMLCANDQGRDTCTYDSGGPLVGYVDGQLALVGITSYGNGCAEFDHPGVYTRVSTIRAWALAEISNVNALG